MKLIKLLRDSQTLVIDYKTHVCFIDFIYKYSYIVDLKEKFPGLVQYDTMYRYGNYIYMTIILRKDIENELEYKKIIVNDEYIIIYEFDNVDDDVFIFHKKVENDN